MTNLSRGRHDSLFARYLRLPIVEIEEHCRMTSRRQQQIFEAPQHERPDRVALVAREEHPFRTFAVKYVEVVQPEVDQHFFELTIRVNRAV